jgi:uncharacterized membrane protein
MIEVRVYYYVGMELGANGLPYAVPLHPNLVHLTLGLFIVAILFDLAATLLPIARPILKFLELPTLSSGFYDVGWYNLVAAVGVTFLTATAGFFELWLALPAPAGKSTWGLTAGTTMLIHGGGGMLLLGVMAGMAVWRGLQRYKWRLDRPQQVQWSYLLLGVVMMLVLVVHGTLGAHLGGEFGVHNTAANLLRAGRNPNLILQP